MSGPSNGNTCGNTNKCPLFHLLLTEEKCKFRKALDGKLEILSFHLRSPVGKGKMTIPQQGSPAMELVEGKIKRRSVSGLWLAVKRA